MTTLTKAGLLTEKISIREDLLKIIDRQIDLSETELSYLEDECDNNDPKIERIKIKIKMLKCQRNESKIILKQMKERLKSMI